MWKKPLFISKSRRPTDKYSWKGDEGYLKELFHVKEDTHRFTLYLLTNLLTSLTRFFVVVAEKEPIFSARFDTGNQSIQKMRFVSEKKRRSPRQFFFFLFESKQSTQNKDPKADLYALLFLVPPKLKKCRKNSVRTRRHVKNYWETFVITFYWKWR